MADFEKLAEIAQRLINKNGRTVAIEKQGKTPVDPTQPWRGQAAPALVSISGKAVFVNSSDLGYTVKDENNVRRAVKVALFAANSDEGNSLEGFSVIVDNLVRWRITRAEVLAPGDTKLLYMFEVER